MRIPGRSSPALLVLLPLWAAFWLAGLSGLAGLAMGQDPRPLYQQEPYDLITLNEENENEVLKVLPLDLPGRRVPEDPRSVDLLRVRLVSEPGEEYEIAWRDVARHDNNGPPKVELFEQRLLAAAEALVNTGKFDEAFDYYRVMRQRYPKTPGLRESVQNYLFRNAGAYFRQQRSQEALGILEELYQQNRKFAYRGNPAQSVLTYVDLIANKVVGDYMEKGDIASAQAILRRLGNTYGRDQLASVVRWREQLAVQAAGLRDQARQFIQANQLREAHAAVGRMLEVWPDVEGGREVAADVERLYPLVSVGVRQLPRGHDPRRLDNWGARRTGRLRHRLIMELIGPGPEGGQYACPLGTAAQSEDRRTLTIQLSQSGEQNLLTGFDLSRRLVAMANPENEQYQPTWGELMAELRVEDVFRVPVSLRRPYVLPEAHLQVFLDPLVQQIPETEPSNGPYMVAERTDQLLRFVRDPQYAWGSSTQPAEIVERVIEDPEEAVKALLRGEIDVLDRLMPMEAEKLADNRAVRVARYALPSIHVLLPNYQKPFTANRTFRRALTYGISRQATLEQVVLGGQKVAGCEVVSGPFPKGFSADDPLAYAYDVEIEPRGYNPRLAAALVRLAGHELAGLAKTRGEPAPELQPLLLGHPPEFLARLTCEAIARQLDAIGIQCKLEALPPGVTRDADGKFDLVYTELAVWEPLVDARRMLATQGLTGNDNPYIDLACRRLDVATNWRQVAQRLRELHFIAHNEVIVVPLWQIADHYAYHPRVKNTGDRLASLYSEIEQWQIVPRLPGEE